MRDVDALLAVAGAAAREAGAFLAGRYKSAKVVGEARRDIKLSEDAEAETLIVRRLNETGVPVLAEESASGGGALTAERLWVVDPLDGSYNFNRGFDRCAVSIGLLRRGEPEAGMIFDFLRNEMLTGAAGRGANCNGAVISVSGVRRPEEAVLATGLPMNRDFSEASMAAFATRLARYRKVRMLGSAASSLALVAQGVFDVYEEEDIMLWDVAAGAALVLAAGGAVRMTPSKRAPNAVHIIAAAHESLL